MQKLASTKVHLALAALLAVFAAGCDDGGGDDTGDMGNTGGTGGGGENIPPGVVIGDFETESDMPGVYTGYFKDEAQGWEIAWFTYTDMTAGATITPAEGGTFTATQDTRDGAATWVGKMTGTGFSTWGAGMGFNMKIGTPPGAVNLSAYKGIGFWMKANVPVRVKVVDVQTTPPDRGGTCDSTAGACDNNFGFQLSPTSADWEYYTVTWEQLTQETWASQMFPAGPQRDQVIGFQWQVKNGTTFDVAVDDVRLLQ
ncbi:MAG TPA: hypothetical protein VKY73_21545 [Polyangiaceae bacterium]|nr:hypothetical protein [Polyangiaceae bacterium]